MYTKGPSDTKLTSLSNQNILVLLVSLGDLAAHVRVIAVAEHTVEVGVVVGSFVIGRRLPYHKRIPA